MALADVKQEILRDADRRVARIRAATAATIKAKERALDERLRAWKKEREARFKREAERLRQRMLAEREAVKKDALLKKRRELIEEAVALAEERLRKERKAYLPKLLTKAERELKVARVYSREKLPGVEWVQQDIDGLIAETKDGSVSVDYTFETLLNEIKERSVQEISEVLA